MPTQSIDTSLDLTCINTIRALTVDAVNAAQSGHTGTPIAMAPVAYTLWQEFLRFDPEDPAWPNRDRFILSVGHASMLLYSLFYLCGVKAVRRMGERSSQLTVTLDDIRNFRHLGSHCSGHPEYELTAGVETTTGALGQGVANSVGMAIAAQWLGARFNRPGFPLFDYRTYALCGDGCLMEGVSAEAASLAGHLKLSNLCWIYDNNHVTNEGRTSLAFSEDVEHRFLAQGWRVVRVADANNLELLGQAFTTAGQTADRPTLIIIDSHIGWGVPGKQDTRAAHAGPLTLREANMAKAAWGWHDEREFFVPEGVREHFARDIGRRGAALRNAWMEMLDRYTEQYPEAAAELHALLHGELPEGWDATLPTFAADPEGIATSEASGIALNKVAERVPWLLGGSADLGTSIRTRLCFPGAGDFDANHRAGRNFHFGVREHVMGAILNGLALSGLRPFGSGYLIFSDYMRGAMRMSSLMEIPVIHIFGHDSIGLGQDGPTHQPVEQLASLRATPHLMTIRPADANEVSAAWRIVMGQRHQPVALVLSKQAIPVIDRKQYAPAEGLLRGAYILADTPGGRPDVLLLATGSEVALCLETFEVLRRDGVRARVVSMPCWDLFEHQSAQYRDNVLPPAVTARVSVEAASTFGWSRYVGLRGCSLGMETFGASGPLKELRGWFGFTVEHIATEARNQIAKNPAQWANL
ncbi:transketolase [Paludibaculum fermentans]|uniref:Transketolase n=1 Tax=Paludibaculum fermentans TaxID=1473598 RepID=A0A7S7SNE7_PALFE|nr:transketolase [Paludibaculum fermentans]QOY90040.1 transketolase [Paludibaculum fermentans]